MTDNRPGTRHVMIPAVRRWPVVRVTGVQHEQTSDQGDSRRQP